MAGGKAWRALAARVVRTQIRAMAGEAAGVLRDDDPEHLHQMRVASRRLRAALRLFGGALPRAVRRGARAAVRRVTRALGRARDLDVQLLYVRGQAARDVSPAAAVGLAGLVADLAAARAAAQRGVRRAVARFERGARFRRLRRWARRVARRARAEDAGAAALRAAAPVGEALDAMLAFAPFVARAECVEELHAMRIAAKRLRYAMEPVAPLFGAPFAAALEATKALQAALGDVHDCDMWAALVLARRALVPPDHAPGLDWIEDERRAVRAERYAAVVAQWRAHETAGTWDALRDALAGASDDH